jgi:hypothetical protein
MEVMAGFLGNEGKPSLGRATEAAKEAVRDELVTCG